MDKKKRWYQKVSNWLMIIACLILIPILVMNLSVMYQANKDKDKVPSIFGYKPFIVLSGSMETKIKVGDLIITKEVDPTTLTVDDIIAFRDAQDTVTTHRIIEIVDCPGETEDKCFMTKGDNNSSQDQQLVEYSDVEGIYLGRIPGIGNIMDSLASPATVIIIVLGITVIFGVAFMVSSRKEMAQEKKEFLEYKRLKEQEEKAKVETKTTTRKKTSTTKEKKQTSKK